MIFQRDKKQLWRYASEHHPPLNSLNSFANCCSSANCSSSTIHRSLHVNTPPPPYSSVSCGIDCSDGTMPPSEQSLMHARQNEYHQSYPIMEPSMSATDSVSGKQVIFNRNGCCCEKFGDNMPVDDCEFLNNRNPNFITKAVRYDRHPTGDSNSSPTAMVPQVTAFAANVFRNCCGVGWWSIESSTDTNATINNNCYGQSKDAPQNRSHHPPLQRTVQIHFSDLTKRMTGSQLTALLRAVKSFRDSASNVPPTGQQSNCILLKRDLILGEEPYVIACRLFFWNDLKSAAELKRLPICTNGNDPVYICCNPLHWCRILVPESAPPPYQPVDMDRMRTEDLNTVESTPNEGNINTESYIKSRYHDQILESFTTNGEGKHPLVWCQVAYWELTQRVGERFLAEKSLINIYSEGPRTGTISSGMCLKDLVDKKATPSPETVQKTRRKIGLGVTLSQEADGVWLYNRSTSPVFVHSPTLSECWFHVCKILPGYCVKAFDIHRARECCLPSTQITGPVDRYSMRISFAKGWGSKYCRQDITACPCWLEVLFTRR